MQRDVFVSYSHKRDVPLALAVQKGLRRIGRKWSSARALNVFRDTTSLAASTDLAGSILKELNRSRYFLYIASPEAVASRWCREEVEFWRDHPEGDARDRFLIALSDGEIVWDESATDFDWTRTTALPRELRGVFATEPLWVDLRAYRETGERSLDPGEFRDKVATLAAAVHNCTKDQLDSEDLREQRKLNRYKNIGLVGLASLALLAASSGGYAWLKRGEALARARTSASQALAARALEMADSDPRKAAQFALYAEQVSPTSESAQALARAVAANTNVARHIQGGSEAVAHYTGSGGATPTRVAISRDGGMLAYYSGFDADAADAQPGSDRHIHLYDLRAGKELPVLRGKGWPQRGGALELSADGGLLAVERAFNEIELWDVRRGQLLRELVASNAQDLPTAGLGLQAFALSGDGRWLAASFREPQVEPLRMAVWDATSGAEISRTDAGADFVDLTFDGANQLRVDAPESGRTRTFAPATRSWGAPRAQAPAKKKDAGAGSGPSQVAVAADNQQILIGAEGGTVSVYDAQRRRQRTLGSFSWPVTSLATSGDGKWVAAASSDGAISLFRAEAPAAHPRTNEDRLKPGELTGDGRLGFRKGADGGTDIWSLASSASGPRKIGSTPHAAFSLTATRDGGRIAATDSLGALSVWDSRTDKNAKGSPLSMKGPYLYAGNGAGSVQFVGDGDHVAGSWKQGLLVIDIRTMEVSQSLPGQQVDGDFAVSRDGKTLAATDAALGGVTVWRWSGNGGLRKIRTAKITDHMVSGISVSDDGSKVAVVDNDLRISVLDVSSGRVVTAAVVAQNAERHTVFSPDSRIVAQAFDAGTESRLQFWDTGTGDVLGSWPLGAAGAVQIFPAPEGGVLALDSAGAFTTRAIGAAEWRTALCSVVPQPLPPAEYDRYLAGLGVDAPCRG